MGNIDFKIDGLEEIKKMLSELPNDVNEMILQDLMLKAGGIVKKEIIAAVPEGNSTKRSKASLKNKVAVVKSSTGGAQVGFKRSGFYARFLEFGTKVRKTLGRGKYKAGANRGTMEKRSFIQKAHETAAPKAVAFFSDNFAKLINQAIKKQLKRIR